MPAAGRDYPGSYAELLAWFPDEGACLDYLEWLRWPDGLRCPRCAEPAGLAAGQRARGSARVCGRQTSVTAGTIFHRTRTPLRLWFAAAWLMTSQKHGVSALGVQRTLGLGSYQTAWAMLHRYREAMVRPGRERLRGHVEVDETYVGGVEEQRRRTPDGDQGDRRDRRGDREPQGFRAGAHAATFADVSKDSLIPFVDGAIEPAATVHTDGWQAYLTLPEHGYEHERTVMRQQSDPAHVVMPGVHRVASLLKRWLLGTHQGAVSPEHLDAYLNEFTFRFNRRRSGAAACSSTGCSQQAVVADPVTYRSLIANPSPTGRRPTRAIRAPAASPPRRPASSWRQSPANTGLPELPIDKPSPAQSGPATQRSGRRVPTRRAGPVLRATPCVAKRSSTRPSGGLHRFVVPTCLMSRSSNAASRAGGGLSLGLGGGLV